MQKKKKNISFSFKIFWYIGILLPKLFWPTVRKNCSNDQEKLLKFEAEGYSIVKDSNADLTVGNWESKIDPQSVVVLV